MFTGDLAGQGRADMFISQSRGDNSRSAVCVADKVAMSMYPSLDSVKALLTGLSSKPGLQVIVLLVTESEYHLILQAAQQLNLRGRFVFISSHSNTMMRSQSDVSSVTRGSITLVPNTVDMQSFRNWVATLTLTSHGNIPDDWFEEFWQHVHRCRLDTASVELRQYIAKCSNNLSLRNTTLQPSVEAYNTIITTQILAQGLFDIQQCRNSSFDHLTTCFNNLQVS